MKAASWFLEQGHAVYFPAVQQDLHDFVALVDGRFKTVQVKTATRSMSGKYGYIQCRTRLTNKYQSLTPQEVADLWVIVYEDRLWVIPADDIDSSNLCLGCDLGVTTERQRRWQKYRVR